MFPALTLAAALLAAPIQPATALAVHDAPTAQRLDASSVPSALCSIRSNAGNCYAAGEFCRQGDLGKTTTDADGQTIACVMESGRPHWHDTATSE